MRIFVFLHVYIYIYVQHVVCIFRYLQEHILHAGENRQYDLDMNVELSQTPICMFWGFCGAGGVHFFLRRNMWKPDAHTHNIEKLFNRLDMAINLGITVVHLYPQTCY